MISLLKLLNLLDYKSERLSITNIAVWVCVIKVALVSQVNLPEIAALMLALMNYAHKRHKAVHVESEEAIQGNDQGVDLVSMQAKLDGLVKSYESVQKLSDETKKLLSQANLATAFVPRSKRGE